MRTRNGLVFAVSLGTALAAAGPAFAWGSVGHRLIAVVAAGNLSRDVPAFLRTPDAVFELGEAAREPDRARNAGQPHDRDRDPGHFVDVSDDLTVLEGPRLSALPSSRQDFDTALRAVGSDQYRAGYLPYSVMDGYEQLVMDFAYWRSDVAAQKFGRTAADKAWATRDRRTRELLTLRDLGIWAHYVGDASQPLHVTLHYNGWGDYPNPQNFQNAPGIHSRFETAFVSANIGEKDIADRLAPYRPCGCTIQSHVANYLAATQSHVSEVYRMDMAHVFDTPGTATPEAKAYVASRIADGASALRDMVQDAWTASGDVAMGYTVKLPMKDIESGKVDPMPMLRD